MKRHKYSPNWYWEKLGFSVYKNDSGGREILDKNKCLYCKNAGHSVENYLGEYEYRTSIGDVPDSYLVNTESVIEQYNGSSKIELELTAQGIIDRLINQI